MPSRPTTVKQRCPSTGDNDPHDGSLIEVCSVHVAISMDSSSAASGSNRRLRIKLFLAMYVPGSRTVPGVVEAYDDGAGFEILRTWRIVEIVAVSLVIYMLDILSLWFLVESVGLALRIPDLLVLLGSASLSTLVPSGPAFLGTLQFAYALAIEFAGGARALGVAAATLAQLCLLLPVAVAAAGILAHRSGTALYSTVAAGQSNAGRAGE